MMRIMQRFDTSKISCSLIVNTKERVTLRITSFAIYRLVKRCRSSHLLQSTHWFLTHLDILEFVDLPEETMSQPFLSTSCITAAPQAQVLNVLVHSFSWCFCGHIDFPVHHIKVKTWMQPVVTGQAVALTYGIGDFDRNKHIFGHVENVPAVQVKLVFGSEWDIQQIMTALVELSETHSAIWMDQLSIPQDAVSIAVNLQNMPQIYRTFDVVVLLPDALCSCLKEITDLYETGHPPLADKNGDLNISLVVSVCLNAFPVSSYHFRLWTKQEFTYARTISIRYCGLPVSCCSSGVRDWIHHTSKNLLSDSGHLSQWSRWKYGQCVEEAVQFGDQFEDVAYSEFRQAQTQGRLHLCVAVISFYIRRDGGSSQLRETYKVAKFILGAQLQRKANETEAVPIFESLHSQHVASEPKDFALAVLPAITGYCLPARWQTMTLSELVDDGIEQHEQIQGRRCQTKLPKGLFETGPASMRCKPSLYLPADGLRNLVDVYGALYTLAYQPLPGYDDRVMLHLRTGSRAQPGSRLSQAKTYFQAFGDKSTATSLAFVRRVRKFDFGMFGRVPFGALAGWADKVLSDNYTSPTNRWPSPDHERAIFRQSLLRRRKWDPLPEVNHERVCFELMCDFLCIDPVVARQKNLGLVVKTEDPPCIGFVNGAVHDSMNGFERDQRGRDVDAPELAAIADDCLTIVIGATASSRQTRFVTLEAMRLHDHFHLPEIGQQPRSQDMPMYHVVGVWFFSGRDDPSIGAELAESWATCDAILV
jgi:hypothetical protein